MSTSQSYSDQARDEAIMWFLRLRDELANDLEQPEFQYWLAQSLQHRQAFEAVQAQWQWTEQFTTQDFVAKSEAASYRPTNNSAPRHCPGTKWMRMGGAASLVVLIGVGLFSSQGLYGLSQSYRVEKGQRQTLVLADGSTVDLNTDSEINVLFNYAQRQVELVRGEAFFNVQHAVRPFTVHAANVIILDIGTAFDVYRKAGLVEVAVADGVVEVKNQSSLSLINAGQLAKISDNETIKVSTAEIASTTAWRKGELIFRGRRLDEVLSEIGRYHDVQIQLSNKKLAALAVTGSFKIEQLDTMLNAVSHLLSVKVKKLTKNQIIIESI